MSQRASKRKPDQAEKPRKPKKPPPPPKGGIMSSAGSGTITAVVILSVLAFCAYTWTPAVLDATGSKQAATGTPGLPPDGTPKLYTYSIVKEYHHDPTAFTQVQNHPYARCPMPSLNDTRGTPVGRV